MLNSISGLRASASPLARASTAGRLRQAVLALALFTLACGSASSEMPVSSAKTASGPAIVEVFVTDWCPYCRRLEAFLQENQIAYERKNIEESAEFAAQHEELGGGGIPVTRINGSEVIRGFRPDVLAEALGLSGSES